MKLRTKFAVALVFIAFVLSIGVYGGFELYKQELVADTRADVNETAVLTAEQIDADIRERKDFVGFVASRPAMARFDESDENLRQFVANSRFFAAEIVAANGTVVDIHGDVTRETERELVGSDVGDRTYVRRALEGEVYVTDARYVNATDRYLLVFSAPIIRNDRIEGAFAAAIYVDELTFFSGVRPLETSDQAATVSTGDQQLYESRGAFDDAITATATVESTGWTVEVDRDRSGLISRLRWLAIFQGMGLLLVFVSVAVLGVWEYRSTLAQTDRLLDGFDALQRGEYDHSLSLAAADEWERISEGFNDLAEGLATREARLREHEQRLQVFNRVLRHNLRNDMGVVLGYAALIRDEADDGRLEDAARQIHATARDLVDLGEKARELEGAIDENQAATTTPIDVVAVVSSTLASLREEYPAVDIAASLPDEAWVRAVPAIDLAIENVCENACEHNEGPEQRVEVTVATTDRGTVTVTVADDGPGFPDVEREVFEREHETQMVHGQGLGLWCAYWMVERSGGDLQFSSNEPTGTVVTLELERAGPSAGSEPGRESVDAVDRAGESEHHE